MDSSEIRKKFLEFFEKRGHKVVPSSSLVPKNDPSVLLTTAGMQQFKPYFLGGADPLKDFGSQNVASIQKSFRTSDIDEVGDESHLTFFEMLGNFSFGGYWKEEAIKYAYEFITGADWMNLKIDYVSIFGGDPSTSSGQAIPADEESEKIWKELGIKDVRRFGREDNFWGPTGAEGPCGPTTEIYIKNSAGKSVEIWNIVFNEYYCGPDKKLSPLKIKGIDTGMGLERLAMVSQNVPTIFETDLFGSLMELLPAGLPEKTKRILTDHARGIAFLVSEMIVPSNKNQGYILRRLIRRIVVHEYINREGVVYDFTDIFDTIIREYPKDYKLNSDVIKDVFRTETSRFVNTIQQGIKELEKIEIIDGQTAFRLYESYGLPYEIIKDLGGDKVKGLTREDFDAEFKKHQKISRAGAEKKFGGHGLYFDNGELKAVDEEELKKVTRLHTATHLLQAALREILGDEVRQAGSDITAERTRFDFSFPRKLTPEEIKNAENRVNEIIKKDLPMQFAEMPFAEAVKTGALYSEDKKYPEIAKVYFAGENLENAVSKELCGGPHVTHTGEVGNFKILKEEAVSTGIRRIRASVE